MRRSCCHSCGYFREEKREDGSIRNYCNDLDCTVDPHDPECNYHEDYDDQQKSKYQTIIVLVKILGYSIPYNICIFLHRENK